MRVLRLVAVCAATCSALACASARLADSQPGEKIRERTGALPRLAVGEYSIPPNVVVDDGITREEAVAIALWNNAGFQARVAQLGFARADLVDAGVLTNPVLSVLFPVGPKQLEATIRWPIEALWERPRRLKAAGLSYSAAAEGLVQTGLDTALAA